jgi:UDP-N-acetylglucosamine:LPS N-acetylglucosamine transferase
MYRRLFRIYFAVMKKKTICLFTAVEGHWSLAQAITQTLSDEFEVVTYMRKKDRLFTLYMPFYKSFPWAFILPYKFAQLRFVAPVIAMLYKWNRLKETRKFCVAHQPVLCISTHFAYNGSLEQLAKENGTPFINVLSDPRSIHRMLVAKGAAMNLAFDEEAATRARALVPSAHCQPIGWLVRQEYDQEYNQKIVRKNLGLKIETLTILLSSGYEGTNTINKILPALTENIAASSPLQIIVACGHNAQLLTRMRARAAALRARHSSIQLFPIGFTHEMHLYIQAADLVVGKAGPNTLFETVATETPFFAITHIAGQEDGNLALIEEYGLGYVEENAFKATGVLSRIIAHPEELTAFQPALRRLAEYNRQAKKHLLHIVKNS